jgi:hypothetical protein
MPAEAAGESMKGPIQSHTREINRCNQRGGRFLSIIDLLEAGTLDLELASYLGAAILEGSSFLVGAVPGGGGKTTVMGALLNFVPPETDLHAATPGVPGAALRRGERGRCYICHEIGQGPYFAYLWGQDIRDFFRLPSAGLLGATNLHADDIDQAREIVCGGCGVREEDFAAWPLFVFLEVRASRHFGAMRQIREIREGPDRPVYRLDGGGWDQVGEPRLGSEDARKAVQEMLGGLREAEKYRIEDVRKSVLERFAARS